MQTPAYVVRFNAARSPCRLFHKVSLPLSAKIAPETVRRKCLTIGIDLHSNDIRPWLIQTAKTFLRGTLREHQQKPWHATIGGDQ